MGEETEPDSGQPYPAICPDFYSLIQAAKYLNVAPWVLMEQSIYWQEKALKSLTAENQARKILEDRS